MLLNLSRGKKHLLIALCLLVLGACKQSEFYEKQGLSEISTPSGDTGGNGGGIVPGGDGGGSTGGGNTGGGDTGTGGGNTGGGNTGGGNTGDNGGGGGTTNPPVVVNPPVTEPPVVTPPVTNPPVTNPPVVVNPPVVNPPVVEPPITEPVVILNDRSEIFTQNKGKNGDVDILWVIDDSGSMADEQDALGKNFQSFINQFIEKDIDFKMAITTTDGTSTRNGKMVGDSAKLTSASAKGNKTAFLNNFTKWVKVGTSGSGIEQGLKTSASFMDRYASSFLRPDAFLVVVYISDEEDQSDKKVQEYLDKLQAQKTNKGMVKAYSIVTVKNYGNQWETIGNRYKEVATATAGITADIKQDFSTILLDMGGRIVNLMDSFALNESPYEDKVDVYVNNVKVSSGYVFNAAQRTVKFDANSLPAEGSKVEVRYKVKATVLGAI
ncbi:VWA domain-containing protein [Bacteriovorax stolpii]|uniref:Uncharacterized protein n=1 Tax=Bacteriovorax stolpii TaxID=960 RepID=A0A2K9NT58_BACTC|nr:vWA domain-containing protein [Bacteriovorax stolpii]AUN98682.1 hypothetical protein C0V70_11330 [Bacteriovorax stolpii]QDK41338.1 VWA domain-containing protein [Bacteriovorax stolpii]TDP55809.1 hypothetical protein C8D79_0866 [Bacteriovorax stolpii]